MTRILAPLTVLVLALGMSISAFAGSTKTDNITLYHDAQLNGTTIPAGDYTVKCETNGTNAQVKFIKNGKEVASASGQTKDLGKKTQRAQLVLQNGGGVPSITEVDLCGSKTGVTFDVEYGERREVKTYVLRKRSARGAIVLLGERRRARVSPL